MTEKTKQNDSIESLVKKAESIGHNEIPQNFDELGNELVEIMKRTGKIFSAKEMFEITQKRNSKFYSDKMWNLAKKGVLVKLPVRGYYQYNAKNES